MREYPMSRLSAARPGVVALVALTLGGCYYTSPYGYAPYYTPVPAVASQREVPVAPAASAAAAPPAASSSDAAGAVTYDTAVVPAPVYVAPAYVPYPYYYPAYYPAWYGPPVAIGFGFWGHWGGGHWRGGGGHWGRPWGGGHGGGHRH
ncbi:hypothetical protein C6T60_11710 [Burkholderia multivorans]|nr:hypothetical protein C6T60_11710 [Burkholderia multivorans]